MAEPLDDSGIAVVWLGGEDDRALNCELASKVGIDSSGEFSLLELAEIGRRAAFAITNDSGPMHVLAAADIAVFGLFGPSDWRRNHALGQESRVIACSDLVAGFEGEKLGDCLGQLGVDVVWSKLTGEGLIKPST